MCDVDRYVDRLYLPAIEQLELRSVKTEWHRYAADLNRVPTDVDEASVIGSANPKGKFRRGFHWQITTTKEVLMPAPISQVLHQELVHLIYEPFHESVRNQYQFYHQQGFKKIYHVDLHSMPSVGTSEHNDPGEKRADIVISDCQGKSADPQFVDLVISAYVRAGFKVGFNWPYFGGRVSEQYGSPDRGQHAVQAELNRGLYMNEVNKKLLPDPENLKSVQQKLSKALQYIKNNIPALP